jgi:recombination protein RecA
VERDKALEMALGQIEKQYGKGAIMRMDEQSRQKIAAIPTGALSLDLALGIGGLPRGRVVEIYGTEASGKTSLALHCVAEAQKAGGIAAFIDAEHALDPSYAKAIGVDVEALLVSQPDNGEQALEIADMLVRSGAVDILVIDSVAALTPRAEIEGEMGDTHVGLQARLMSQALRKLAGTLNRSKTCAIFVNQIREKVGVMFGCMNYQTRVTLADGSQEKIGKIVTQRRPVKVLSYDPESGRVVPRKVTNWFDNGPTDEFLTIKVARGAGNGRAQFSCTPDHEIRTPGGWRRARELQVGDRVLQSVPHYLSDFQWEVVLGALLGEGALSATRSGHGARLRWGHGRAQVEYSDWKASLFANVGTSRSTNERGAVFHDAKPLAELAELRRAVYIGGRKVLSHDYLKRLTPLSLAVWYMDDASLAIRSRDGQRGRVDICVEALEPTSRTRLVEYLRDEWGITCRPVVRAGKAVLQFRQHETETLHALIAPFVHPSMEYKLLPRYRGRFFVEPEFAPMRFELLPMPIVAMAPTPAPKDRVPHRYDIEVEGTHNYFVDGVMVHNSPETQPGGRALKFYSSVRLDVRRIESLKDGTDFVGNRVRVKVVKNKLAPPFKQAEFDILFGEGISKEGSILDVGVDQGIVKKAGAWYTYEGEQLGQGRENARQFLKEHDDVASEIYKKVTERLGLVPTDVTGAAAGAPARPAGPAGPGRPEDG